MFVHGLHGSKEATWTAEVKNEKILWPRDLLQQDIKEARILTWGYDSYIAHFWTKSSVGNVDTHAKNLCADLSSLRENTNTVRIVSFHCRVILVLRRWLSLHHDLPEALITTDYQRPSAPLF